MGLDRTATGKIKFIDLTDATQVNGGGASDIQELTPPAGFIYRVLSLRWIVPGIAGATGSSYISIYHEHCGAIGEHIAGETITDAAAAYLTPAEVATVVHMMVCSQSEPLYLQYQNSSDTNQTGTRTLHVIVRETPERV